MLDRSGSVAAHARRSSAIMAIAAGLLAASSASAQDGPEKTSSGATPQTTAEDTAAPEGGLGDIVVTARKVEENLQDVPVAVTVQTGEQLVQQGARTVVDIARFTPGLFMREGSSTPSALNIALRGQVQTDVLITLDPSVGTYVDDVYWARAYGLNAELLDVANVQVLKGPQGTLFGRNTTGGAILFKTNDPDLNDFGGKATVTYGRFDYRVGELILNAPIITDVLGVRAAGRISKRDGRIKNFAVPNAPLNKVGRRYAEIDDRSFRLKVLARPTDSLSVLMSGDYWKTDAAGTARKLAYAPPADIRSLPPMSAEVAALLPGAIAAGCATCVANYIGTYGSVFGSAVAGGDPTAVLAGDPALTTAYNRAILDLGTARLRDIQRLQADNRFGVANNAQNHVETETKTLSSIVTLDAPFGQLKAVGAWREIENSLNYDFDGTPYPIHVGIQGQKVSQYSAELQGTGTAFDEFLKFAAGVFYFHEHGFDGSVTPRGPVSFVNQAGVRTNLGLSTTAVSYFDGTIDNDSLGAYAQSDFAITDRLNVTAGVRYSADDRTLINRAGNVDLIRAGFVSVDASGVAVGENYTGINADNFRDLRKFYTLNPNGTVQCFFPAANCALRTRASFSGWSYTFGADYHLTDGIMVYAKHSKGFRSGGHNLRATNTTIAVPFKPEISYTTEVGAKTELFDRRVRFNAAGYYSRVNNLQRSTLFLVNGSPVTFLGNAASSRIYGMEADLTVAPVEGLTLIGTVALTDPKYLKFQEVPSRTNLTGDRSSETFESVPHETFSFQGSYELPVGERGELTFAANYSWTGKVKLVSGNFFAGNPFTVIVDPFTGKTIADSIIDAGTSRAIGVLGGSISYTFDDRYKFMAWARNLTNESGVVNVTNASLGYVNAALREPRTYGLTISAQY